jgi:hypothetical protein
VATTALEIDANPKSLRSLVCGPWGDILDAIVDVEPEMVNEPMA